VAPTGKYPGASCLNFTCGKVLCWLPRPKNAAPALACRQFFPSRQFFAPIIQPRPVPFYEAHDVAQLRERVRTEYKGKTVVIAGHSNTLLPIIKAFGAKSPLEQIGENQYDNLFRLKISPRGKASVQAFKYGARST
jgi:2,3-bisphosphoglycerate-dependent phosphoglycerate mutase